MSSDKKYDALKSKALDFGDDPKNVGRAIEKLIQEIAKDRAQWLRESRLIQRDLNDLFARIANIELKLFPHLQRDINQLRDVMGPGDGPNYNPLDFRDRKRKD